MTGDRKTGADARRARVLELLAKGLSRSVIAERLGVTKGCVEAIAKKAQEAVKG
jgi:transcriptional regulator